jgi:Flavodoxin domain
MRALVVFESMFGNTERIARAVAEGLAENGADVEVQPVATAGPVVGYDLVVLGAPTHAFSLSRASTRADAVRQGADPSRAGTSGVREWLDELPESGPSPRFAVFDSRADKARHLPGSAARRTARTLRSAHHPVAGRPTSFYVHDVAGPLLDGEEDRARAWARALA